VSTVVVDLLIPMLRDHREPEVLIGLESLAHATNLMTHTVSQLMTSSAGAAPTLQVEDVSLPRLVERACAYYGLGARAKHLELIFSAADAIPPVETDRVLVAAILDNLLSNAVKYSPIGKRIWVDVQPERAGVICRVSDEGPGLSREDQARLFLPGVRLGQVPSAGEPSTGYGLAVARRFVDQLGGEIRCASSPGQGATFSLWLPPRPPAATY
jgi:signal transduction histidine kinase